MDRKRATRGTYVLKSALGKTSKRYGKKVRVRGTHILESASGAISEDTERKRASEGHSHPGKHIGKDK